MVRQRTRPPCPTILVWSATLLMTATPPVMSQVAPTTQSGVPEMVIPAFLETGAPAFTTPTETQTPGTGTSPSTTPSTGSGTTGSGDGFVATGYSQYLGQTVGSGQCVALVQTADPNVGLTATWRQGDAVQDNNSLAPGTVIATFGPNGTYTNSLDGSSHAAIYLGQNAQGIQVEDQWVNQPASIRTIAWNNPSGRAANTGSQFYVVTHG